MPHTRILKCFVLNTLCSKTKHLRNLICWFEWPTPGQSKLEKVVDPGSTTMNFDKFWQNLGSGPRGPLPGSTTFSIFDGPGFRKIRLKRGQKSNAVYEFFHPESCWEELRADLMLPAADKNHFHYMAALCKLPSLPNWKGFSAIFQRPFDLRYKKAVYLYIWNIFFFVQNWIPPANQCSFFYFDKLYFKYKFFHSIDLKASAMTWSCMGCD